MTKNAPLQSPRMICQVLGIGFFLFCAALYAASAKADAGQMDDHSSEQSQQYSTNAPYQSLGLGYQGRIISLNLWGAVNGYSIGYCAQNYVLLIIKKLKAGLATSSDPMCVTTDFDTVGSIYVDKPDDPMIHEQVFTPISSSSLLNITPDECVIFRFLSVLTNCGGVMYGAPPGVDYFPDGEAFYFNSLPPGNNVSDFWFDFVGLTKVNPIPPTPPANLSSTGVSINPNWFCCADSCGYPISMPAQLGWWGIGATSTRAIKWGIDNTPITNTIDFSNKTNSLIQISSSTSFGFHVLHLEIYINNQLLATGSANIQIVAGSECANTNSDQFNAFCEFPCAGLATSTNPLDLPNLQCGLQKFGCWLVKPMPSSISYVIGQFNGLTAKFPIAPFTKLYDDLNLAASDTQIISPGNIEIPFWSTTSRTYVGKNFDLGSSTLSHSYTWTKIRRLEVIGMWCIGILPIILILIKLIL